MFAGGGGTGREMIIEGKTDAEGRTDIDEKTKDKNPLPTKR